MDPDSYAFAPRPARAFPAGLVEHLRYSLHQGAGRIGRLWVEELYQPGDLAGETTWLIAAELRGLAVGEAAREDAEADLRSRLLAAPGLDDIPEPVVYVFDGETDTEQAAYVRGLEPIFGEHHDRQMRLRELAKYQGPAPREIPEALTHAPSPMTKSGFVFSLSLVLVVAGVVVGLLAWLIPGSGGWNVVRIGLILLVVGFAALVVQSLRKNHAVGSVSEDDVDQFVTDGELSDMRTLPHVLAAVVQARNELFDPGHASPMDLARYGLVAVFTLDPTWRNDPAWLAWMARRLRWLRDHAAETADETRIAQRLEAESDDLSRHIPLSVAGNAQTFWVTPYYRHVDLPEGVIPADRLLPILITTDDPTRGEEVDFVRAWPPGAWPLHTVHPVA